MDDEEIAVAVLSLTAPGIEGWRVGKERTEIARRVNDYGASLVQQRPDRFGYFATLPLPDIDSALKELDRAYYRLKVDGVVLHSNYDGIYLANPAFEPVWEELNRRSAVVFIHPTTPKGVKILPRVPGPLEDYPAETTKAALDLVIAGHLTRFGATKIILSHGGGFLPYAATRFAELKSSLAPDRTAAELTALMQSFYFDTALCAPSGLPSLLAFAPRGHVVFGTDYPYASENVGKAIALLSVFQVCFGLKLVKRTRVEESLWIGSWRQKVWENTRTALLNGPETGFEEIEDLHFLEARAIPTKTTEFDHFL